MRHGESTHDFPSHLANIMKIAVKRPAHSPGKLSLVVLAILASTAALADDSGWYIGGNAGKSTARIDDARIISGLMSQGVTSATISDSDRDNGYKLFGGYQFNNNFALEAGAYDLGNFGFKATTVPSGTFTGNANVRGLNLDLIGTLPLTERFSVFGRVGANYAETRDTFSGTGLVAVVNPYPSAHEINPKIGLGVQYALTKALAMRAEVERFRINDAVGNKGDIDLVSVGLVYRFGTSKPAPIVQAPAPYYSAPVAASPPPVVAPPPPPPPVVVPAPPPAPRKVSFSADSLFGFDQSDVSATGRQHLDAFATELKGLRYDVVEVTGHTDRLGAHAYNLKLSTRRAEAVRSYLVQSGGVPASKISAKGVNGSDPITKPADCGGKMPRVKLISCLQPDRRVDIQVTGTR